MTHVQRFHFFTTSGPFLFRVCLPPHRPVSTTPIGRTRTDHLLVLFCLLIRLSIPFHGSSVWKTTTGVRLPGLLVRRLRLFPFALPSWIHRNTKPQVGAREAETRTSVRVVRVQRRRSWVSWVLTTVRETGLKRHPGKTRRKSPSEREDPVKTPTSSMRKIQKITSPWVGFHNFYRNVKSFLFSVGFLTFRVCRSYSPRFLLTIYNETVPLVHFSWGTFCKSNTMSKT